MSQGKKIPDEIKAKIVRLRKEDGLSSTELSERLGVSRYSVLECLRRAGIKRRLMTQQEKDIIYKLHARMGFSPEEISRLVRRARATVYAILKEFRNGNHTRV